jgi:hypothetical protein
MVRALALGIGLGLFAAVGDNLPLDTPLIVLVALANAVGPWVVVAFFAGEPGRSAVHGAAIGAATLIVAVVTYYFGTTSTVGSVFVDPARATAVWAVIAIAVGGPMGAAGAAWSSGDRGRRIVAVGLLAGLLLAEAIARFVEVEGWTGYDLARTALQVAAVNAIVATLAPILLLERDRRLAAAVAVVTGAVVAVLLVVAIPLIRGAATG